MRKTILIGLALCTWVVAKPLPTRRVPAVVKNLGQRYHLPTPSSSSPAKVADLADYVVLQQRHFPGAVVTSGFYDWRTTSRYRGHAGLHLGYDVAMPYGCPFSAGWPGTVTAITPWSGEEYGITVVSPNGMSVTYGHVSARVNIGDQVQAGDILGVIAYNHVDVKMRDATGNYVDFGGNGKVLPSPSWASGFNSREGLMANWLMTQNTLELAQEDLTQYKLETEKRRLQLQSLRTKVPALKESQRMMAEYVEQGLVSRLTVEENREELLRAQKDLAEAEKSSKNSPERTKQLQKSIQQAQNRLSQAKKMASERGIVWKDVENFVQATIASDKALAKNVAAYKKNAASKNATQLKKLEGELARSSEKLKSYQELFEMGGISKNEFDEAQLKHKVLEAQVKALKGG